MRTTKHGTKHETRKSTFGLWLLALALCGAALVAPRGAEAAPALRHAADQKGDFLLFGNTVAFDCSAGVPAPVVGTVGGCGAATNETSPDVFWRADEPVAGQATASIGITAARARSTSVLRLPAGAQVTYARLYWGAVRSGAQNDPTVLVERPGTGGFMQTITADASADARFTDTENVYYQSTADVTALLQARGPGAYRVSDIDTVNLLNRTDARVYVAWAMVVFYRLDTEPQRNLTLFDGLDIVRPGQATRAVLSGFLVPQAGFDAKLGVLAYEGDDQFGGDSLAFNGAKVSNALNPENNFFNATRSFLGMPVSTPGDLPQLTGRPRSLGGVDLDVVDIKALVKQGDTQATIEATTTDENFVLGAFVTSIATFKPDFATTNKTFTNVAGRPNGAVRPGDAIEYTIVTANTGNDVGTGVVLTDQLPAGLTYVPGSLKITAGLGAGDKTDAAGDDQADYNPATRTITVRLGQGATATQGGQVAVGASTTIVFRATVNADAAGTIANQAVVNASGMAGAPAQNYVSDGNGPVAGAPPTTFPVDECLADADCPAARRFCLTAARPFVCTGCRTNADCPADRFVCDPTTRACRGCAADADCPAATPACRPNGSCGQCSATNASRCTGATPVCDVAAGLCAAACQSDKDCSGTTPVCDPAAKRCRACGNDGECGGAGAPICLPTGACGGCSATRSCPPGGPPICDLPAGRCVGCLANADCPAERPICDPASRSCRGCTADADCGGRRPFCLQTGVCAGCRTSADCGGTNPVCSPQTFTCAPCQADGAPSCPDPRFPACQTTGPLAGACTECSGTNAALCTGQKPQCLTDLGLCGCSDADGDAECGGPMSGVVCNARAGICIPGCSDAPMRNRCPAGQTCAAQPAAIGICMMPAGCATDAECAAPRPKCDVGPKACVQCLADGDCGQGFLCEPTAKICVECTAADLKNCSAAGAGAKCLGSLTCGCTADADCGPAGSGRVCDPTRGKCAPGCRGMGGNACPAGFACSSRDMAIGACVLALPGSDAGVPDGGRGDGGADAPLADASQADGSPAPDGPRSDGAAADAPVRGDAGASADAGGAPNAGSYLAGGGCSCEVGGGAGPRGGAGLWLLAPAALLLVGRRRQRAASAPARPRGAG
jgi:uncharacterized repeat protein (TIGR01451 family)